LGYRESITASDQKRFALFEQRPSVRRPAQSTRPKNEALVQGPSLRKSTARQRISLFSRPSTRGSLRQMFRCIWDLGRSEMRAGKSHGSRFPSLGGPLQIGGYPSGAQVTYSGTITADSRVMFIPLWEERLQIERAALWSTTIPCFRLSHRTRHSPFWFRLVAAVNGERLRQLHSENARPEKAGNKMAKCNHVSSRLDDFSSGNPQTQDAASMANPEVRKCR